jgi:glycosyltransferase involved in cell wall biosynthesis
MSQKLISILMPVKNAGRYLVPCINSILNQSHREWELIAINDHSEDESLETLLDLEAGDERITVIPNHGQGIVDALKTGFSSVTGELIHRMDADDIMPAYKLQRMMQFVEKGVVVTGKVKYFSDDWLVGLGFKNYEKWINENMEREDLISDMFVECPLPSPAWMLYKDDLESIGAFDTEILPEDYDLFFRMVRGNLRFKFLKEPIHEWRDSQSRTSRKDSRYFPMAYYPLKIHYFLELFRNRELELVLWGAGKKGKLLAGLLEEKNIKFTWITDNPKKWGIEIHGHKISSAEAQNLKGKQTIIAIAMPGEKMQIQSQLDDEGLEKAKDYWWFC